LFFKPKKVLGLNKKDYFLSCPFMCTVAGGVFAIQAKKIVEQCDFNLFPKEVIKVYGGDDSALYSRLRWKFINGYLEGTEAIHFTSAGIISEDFLTYQNR